jgi:uncharacterized protein
VSTTRRAFVMSLVGATGCSLVKRESGTRAGPPLWSIGRGSSRVTLFGQIPLPDGVRWYSGKIQTVFEQCTEIWFENPEFDASAAIAIRERAALGGPRLSDVISEADRARLAHALRAAGKPENTFDNELVWQAYPPVSELIDALNGVGPMNLPERTLRSLAKEQGKPIRSEWTSMTEIMEFSKSQTATQHLDLIAKTLDGLSTKKEVRSNALAWSSGNIEAATAAHMRMQRKYPELTASLVAKRNARWVSRIEGMLARNRSTFVCVGLGHLIGDESIQAIAEQSGFAVADA